MASLMEILEDASCFQEALEKLKGRPIVTEYALPRPSRFEVLVTRSDFYIGLWRGNTSQREFFARYDTPRVYSLET